MVANMGCKVQIPLKSVRNSDLDQAKRNVEQTNQHKKDIEKSNIEFIKHRNSFNLNESATNNRGDMILVPDKFDKSGW
eukprot:CAMPEP_0116903954 /NCGR_PEP_ID=MMETSP0467-20121206/11073_1 /TAXON_ID=283647 /ORGANISM="Mesodinium pulex, Strain SPMC105" /LENGTH=77 /DNA_ID=CAMNT_0004578391 /DNA_START=290 /DNA_END=520 /DNA_ORIENTATION=-